MDKFGNIISAYSCTGKTTLGRDKKYADNVIKDLGVSNYRYLLTDEQRAIPAEALKGTDVRTQNPQFPQNYIDAVIEAAKKYKLVLLAPSPVYLPPLTELGYEPILVFPAIECKYEYIERAEQRGNNETFIQQLTEKWEERINERLSMPYKKIILSKDEYLEDGLLREGYLTEQDLEIFTEAKEK
ncbi:MAG: hypothetical protein LBN07_02075 [Christensenellaceae bacterium]|jgi:hypothetical protein|nr:hypothetical protein [Christensenellaceae bacterium]